MTTQTGSNTTTYKPTDDPRSHPNHRDASLRMASLGGTLLMQVAPGRSVTIPRYDLPELILRMCLRSGLAVQDLVDYLTAPATDAVVTDGTFVDEDDPAFASLPGSYVGTHRDELDPNAAYATFVVEVEMPPGTLYPAAGRNARCVEIIHGDRLAGENAQVAMILHGMADQIAETISRPVLPQDDPS